MRSQLLPELKIDMLSTSIGSCGRRRGRNDFRDFAVFAFRRLVVFMLSDSFQSVKTNRASMPRRIPSNGLSITNHHEKRHPAIGWPSFMAIPSALLALLTVALTPVSPESGARYFTECEIVERLTAGVRQTPAMQVSKPAPGAVSDGVASRLAFTPFAR